MEHLRSGEIVPATDLSRLALNLAARLSCSPQELHLNSWSSGTARGDPNSKGFVDGDYQRYWDPSVSPTKSQMPQLTNCQ